MPQTYNTAVLYTGNGSTTTFSIPFSYAIASDVKASLNGIDTPLFAVAGSLISFFSAPTTGVRVRVYRQSGLLGRRVDYTDGAVLSELDLDKDSIQSYNMSQEAFDQAQAIAAGYVDVGLAVDAAVAARDTATAQATNAGLFSTAAINANSAAQAASTAAINANSTAQTASTAAINANSTAQTAATSATASALSAYGYQQTAATYVPGVNAAIAAGGTSTALFSQPGAGATVRASNAKLQDTVSIFDFLTPAEIADVRAYTYGVVLNTAVAAAITNMRTRGERFKLYFPAGGYNFTSAISIVGQLSIIGEDHAGQATGLSPTNNIGTVFRFNHTGVGFDVGGTGASFSGFTVFRPQPAVGAGWVPLNSGFDFSCSAIDTTISNVLFWGSNKGVRLAAGGRLNLNDIKGQFFTQGVVVESATDCVRMTGIHLWPFWNNSTIVTTYMLLNLVALEFQRTDGVFLDNYFTIACKTALLFNHGTSGDTTNFKGSNLYLDNCGEGIVTSLTSLAVTAQLSNVNYQCDDLAGVGVSCGIRLRGTGATIGITNFQSTRSGMEAVRNTEGTSNQLWLSGSLYITQWNADNNNFGGINTAVASNFTFLPTGARTLTPVFGAGVPACAAFVGTVNQRNGIAKRMVTTATTDAAGQVVIPHGLGYTPSSVDLFIYATAGGNHAVFNGADNTNIVGKVYLGSTPVASTAFFMIFTAYY